MGRVCCLLACSGNIGVALYALYCVAHVVQLSAQVEHLNVSSAEQASVVQLSTQELDSPFGLGKTLKCDRCGRDGPNDYNCCHAGGAWAGMCGDKAMVTRGAANYTWNQGFAVCQERLKRLKAQRARAETKEVDSLSSEFRVQSHGRPAAPEKFGKTPKCDRCGRDGPNDYNCCHAGGAWAGMCGDKAMITRGAANYTWDQGFAVCQERLKRLKAQRAKNLTKEVDSLYGRPAAAPGHGGPGAGHGGGHSGRGERGAGREGSGAVGGAGAGAA